MQVPFFAKAGKGQCHIPSSRGLLALPCWGTGEGPGHQPGSRALDSSQQSCVRMEVPRQDGDNLPLFSRSLSAPTVPRSE